MSKRSKITTKQLVTLAILIAMHVILSRFLSIPGWNFKIGFSFIPLVIAAVLYGPLYGGLVGLIADLIGATLFPSGTFFPGFAATAFLAGWIYGKGINQGASILRIVTTVLAGEVICSLLLNSLWISILYGAPFWGLIPTRLLQFVVMSIVKSVTITVLLRYLPVIRRMQVAN